ncbi:MAG: DUF4932 domain-containing protein [Bacteroidetes bacterium]|nr:DUF4932 domain-containing protein [Bacteroidota bacterium]
MKMFLGILFISLTTSATFSQSLILNPAVDEKTELLSIVFRLAGEQEYINNEMKGYTDAIDKYFNPYKDDELLKFVKKIRKKTGVSFDAVMSMAIHVELANGTIRLKNNVEKGSLDCRWGKYTEQFILLLNNFYQRTDFSGFFSDHKPLYSIAEDRFSEIVKATDLAWFKIFFGEKPEGSYNLIISLTNGGGNYGVKVRYLDGTEEMYSIIGSWETDSIGNPVYSKDITETIIHEFGHSFCNRLGEKYYPEMKTVADAFFNLVEDNMRRQAYSNSQIMVNEILVRASVIRYFQDHTTTEMKIKRMIGAEQVRGFIWISKLINSMAKYEASREAYPTLDKYMPEIVKLQNSLSPPEELKVTEENRPKLVAFSISNNSKDVDPATRELILTFNKPMMTRPYGMSKGKCGDKCWPDITSVRWNTDKKNELVVSWKLEPNHTYSMIFPAQFIMDENGFFMKETYYLDFSTKK